MRRLKGKLPAALIFLGALGVFAIASSGSRCVAVTGRQELRIAMNRLPRGQARTFCYTNTAGRKIRFILARGAEGKIRSVFDACRVCYAYHKGYAIHGGDLMCRVCGNRYPIDRMTTGKMSCVPVPLAHHEEAGTVRIRTADVDAGRSLF